MKENTVRIALCAAATLLALFLIIFLKLSNHGYYCDEPQIDAIAGAGGYETASLSGEGCMITFSAQKPYLKGFEIFLAEKPAGEGNLLLTVSDTNGRPIDHVEIPLASIRAGSWYKAFCGTTLRGGIPYILQIQAVGTGEAPALFRTDAAYLPNEQIAGDAVIGYAYGAPTFSLSERVILAMFILSFWAAAMWILAAGRKKKYAFVRTVSVLLFLTAVLTWNYRFNTMEQDDIWFESFQADSEALVTDVIRAERDGIYEAASGRYGLGALTSLRGLSNSDWAEGYSYTDPAFLINLNPATRRIAAVGNFVRFPNGEEYVMTDVTVNGGSIVVTINAPGALSPEKYGHLEDAVYLNAEHQELPKGQIQDYASQYGLQGKIFLFLARYLAYDTQGLYLLCAAGTALVFSAITMMLFYKYNGIFAGCFYAVFWLSPWVVNFARNLYWVEFTWFIPMAIGLFCAWKIEKKELRLFSYFATWAAVAIKALCGYEYISTVMMGLVAFPFIDFLMACAGKNKEKAKMLFKTVFALSVAALAGFAAAFCIHATLRGGGTGVEALIKGIQSIMGTASLRTSGADLNGLEADLIPSWNASVWETVCRYFHFSTDVITGIGGGLFPLLCLIPLVIFAYEYKKGKIDLEMISAYGFFFLAALSWFCLAKGHSYVHTHMNYVLWYFGFVQICIYVPASRIYEALCSCKSGSEKQ